MLNYSYKGILTVALPMMLSGFIQSVISITNAAFLGHYSKGAYDAASTGGLWYITIYMIFIGLNDGAQIRMAQFIGEKKPNKFAAVFQSNALILAICGVFLFLCVQFFGEQAMYSVARDKVLAKEQFQFLEIRSYAFWSAIISLSIQAKFLATGKTRYVLYYSLLVAFGNLLMDYVLIFGKFGFPELGLRGAAISSTLAEILGMVFYLSTLIFGKMRKEFPLLVKNWITSAEIRSNIKIGAPLLLQGFIALSVWTVFFTWIEQMGSEELTISLNIRHIYFLAFIPVWGFAGATKTYIAQYLGAKQYDKLPIIQRRIQILCVSFLLLVFHGAFLYPEKLISIINSDPVCIAKSAVILRIVAGAILIYGVSSVYFQTISGSGNTRVTFYVECVATFFYILFAYIFIKVNAYSLEVVWLVEYIYFIVMGSVSFLYLKFFNWQKRDE